MNSPRSSACAFAFAAAAMAAACLAVAACQGQPEPAPRPKEVSFRFLSAEITRFERPITIGAGKRAITYREALVIKLSVDEQEYDSLPPDIEPLYYIGARELHTAHVHRPPMQRDQQGRRLTLTFHVRDWQSLEDGASMVLTIDHGVLERDPERFRDAPKFQKATIVDRR